MKFVKNYRFHSELNKKLQSVIISQQRAILCQMDTFPHYIFRKSLNKVNNQNSSNQNCPQVLFISKRIKSFPNYQTSNLVRRTPRQSLPAGHRDLSIEIFGLNAVKISKKEYQRWSTHKAKIRCSNILKTFICPLKAFSSLTKPLKTARDHQKRLIFHQRMNFSKTQSQNRNQVIPLKIRKDHKYSASQSLKMNLKEQGAAKKVRNTVVVKRQDSPKSIRGWEISKTEEELE